VPFFTTPGGIAKFISGILVRPNCWLWKTVCDVKVDKTTSPFLVNAYSFDPMLERYLDDLERLFSGDGNIASQAH